MSGICEMVVGFRVDEWGDPGMEIECDRPATHLHEGAVRCCDDCAAGLRGEGFVCERIKDRGIDKSR